MRQYHIIFLFFIMASMGMISCSKDPYHTAPSSQFTGSLMYNGNAIGVANNGQGGNVAGKAGNSVYFELTQPGYPLNSPISVVVNQDGSFADLLFNGSYKLSFPTGVYPFVVQDADSLPVSINGNTKLDINVTPYYIFSNEAFHLSTSDSIVTATFNITKVINDSNALPIGGVYLYISRTSFLDNNTNAATSSIEGSAISGLDNLQLTLKVPSDLSTYGATGAADQSYFYVRLGIQVGSLPQLLYSDVQKLSF